MCAPKHIHCSGRVSSGQGYDQSPSESASSPGLPTIDARQLRIGLPLGEGAFCLVYEAAWTGVTGVVLPNTPWAASSPFAAGTAQQMAAGEGAMTPQGLQGMGRAHALTSIPVAVKVLKQTSTGFRTTPQYLLWEGHLLHNLHHRSVIGCCGWGVFPQYHPRHPGACFLVQPLLKGANLADKLQQAGAAASAAAAAAGSPDDTRRRGVAAAGQQQALQQLAAKRAALAGYSSQEALSWLVQVAEALAYLHSTDGGRKACVIHRDVKLENVVLSREGGAARAVLVDLGLHRQISAALGGPTQSQLYTSASAPAPSALAMSPTPLPCPALTPPATWGSAAGKLLPAPSPRSKNGGPPARAAPAAGRTSASEQVAHTRATTAAALVGASATAASASATATRSSGSRQVPCPILPPAAASGCCRPAGQVAAGQVAAPHEQLQLSFFGGSPCSSCAAEAGEGRRGWDSGWDLSSCVCSPSMSDGTHWEEQCTCSSSSSRSSSCCADCIGARQAAAVAAPCGVPGCQAQGSKAPSGQQVGGWYLGLCPDQPAARTRQQQQQQEGSCVDTLGQVDQGMMAEDEHGNDKAAAAAPRLGCGAGSLMQPSGGAIACGAGGQLLAHNRHHTAGLASRLRVRSFIRARKDNPAPEPLPRSHPAAGSGTAVPCTLNREQGLVAGAGQSPHACISRAAAGGCASGPLTRPPIPSPPAACQRLAGLRACVPFEEEEEEGSSGMREAFHGAAPAPGRPPVTAPALVWLATHSPAKEGGGRAGPAGAAMPARYALTGRVGSWTYMAPEVLLSRPYNETVDTFSFGVVCYEVLTRSILAPLLQQPGPAAGKVAAGCQLEQSKVAAQQWACQVAGGARPHLPGLWPEPLRQLIAACWAQDPSQRPAMSAVVCVLRALRDNPHVAAQLDDLTCTPGLGQQL